jgi:hypothetical protein
MSMKCFDPGYTRISFIFVTEMDPHRLRIGDRARYNGLVLALII